jgi:hypothetical protein
MPVALSSTQRPRTLYLISKNWVIFTSLKCPHLWAVSFTWISTECKLVGNLNKIAWNYRLSCLKL